MGSLSPLPLLSLLFSHYMYFVCNVHKSYDYVVWGFIKVGKKSILLFKKCSVKIIVIIIAVILICQNKTELKQQGIHKKNFNFKHKMTNKDNSKDFKIGYSFMSYYKLCRKVKTSNNNLLTMSGVVK